MVVFSDREKIKEILTHPEIWERVRNDRYVDKSQFLLPESWIYLTETGNEVFILSDTDHIHANIMPETRHKAYFMCKRFIEWIKMNTDLDLIHLNIHKKHENAIKLGLLCGFCEVGIQDDRHAMVLRFER